MEEVNGWLIFLIALHAILEYTYEDGSLFVCPECAHEGRQKRKPIMVTKG